MSIWNFFKFDELPAADEIVAENEKLKGRINKMMQEYQLEEESISDSLAELKAHIQDALTECNKQIKKSQHD